MRKNNPVKRASFDQKTERAIKLYENFHLDDAKYADEIIVPDYDVLIKIGKCDGVMYTTIRDKKVERYLHEFKGKARPILASSWDGEHLFFIGGNYDFTKNGIIDR